MKKKVDSGELPIKINAEKQARHVLVGDETSKPDGRSYLTIDISEAQNIINTHYAKGEVIYVPKAINLKNLLPLIKLSVSTDVQIRKQIRHLSIIQKRVHILF